MPPEPSEDDLIREHIARHGVTTQRPPLPARPADPRPPAAPVVLPLPVDRVKPDRGADGEAFAGRPFVMSDQGAVSRGSVATGRVVHAKRMLDTCLMDRMHSCSQLSDRQHKAGKALLRMFHSAKMGGRTTAKLPYVHEEKPEEIEEIEEGGEEGLLALDVVLDEDETWGDRLRRILKSFEGKQADLLMDLFADRHPGVKWLATVQCCLDRMADTFGYEKSC